MFHRILPCAAVCLFGLALGLNSCSGGPPRVLESIAINPNAASGPTANYTATGTYNTSPTTVAPLAVSWYIMGPGIDPSGSTGYSLAASGYPANRCSQIAGGPVSKHTIIALALANPNAPATGTVSSQIFDDLVVDHLKTSEGGFVAGTATLTCN